MDSVGDWHGEYADTRLLSLHTWLLIKPNAMEKLMQFPAQNHTAML